MFKLLRLWKLIVAARAGDPRAIAKLKILSPMFGFVLVVLAAFGIDRWVARRTRTRALAAVRAAEEARAR